MLQKITLVFLLVTGFSPLSAQASAWTEGQREWARHGSRHGRWDCYGKCPPEVRRHYPHLLPYYQHR